MTLKANFVVCCLTILILNTQITSSANREWATYAFYFDKTIATSLKSVTDSIIKNSINSIPSFKNFLASASGSSDVGEMLKYYTKPLDPDTQEFDPYYHVTTKYCSLIADCNSYQNRVANSVGKAFSMQLIGYFFTNRTFGIRIRLDTEQEAIFDNDSKPSLNLNIKQNDNSNNIKALLPGLSFEPQGLSFNPTTNTPHITVGCAPNIPAQVTGTDLGQIIDYETSLEDRVEIYFIEDIMDGHGSASVIQYGKGDENVFVVYPNNKILAKATFQGYPYDENDYNKASSLGLVSSVLMFGLVILWGL